MNEEIPLIDQMWTRFPDLFQRMEAWITPERAFATFQRIADVYAPTLTVHYTRGPVIESLLRQPGVGLNLDIHRNYYSTGNVVVEVGGAPRKPVWCLAHLDLISFLTGPWQDGRYPLTPHCEPRQTEGAREAVALTFDPAQRTMVEAARGQLVMDDEGRFWFQTAASDLPPLTRVVYASQAEWDRASGMVYGAVDNAFGCAALVLAAQVLSHYPVNVLFAFTDEEEGPVTVGNQGFARGSDRLFRRLPPERLPDLVIVTDLHEPVADPARGHLDPGWFGQGALFAGVASGGRGSVTPPHLLHTLRVMAGLMQEWGIRLRESTGYVSRSDDVSAVMVTPNVILLGFPGAYSHFADTPRAHVEDLVHLARATVLAVLVAQSNTWRWRYLV